MALDIKLKDEIIKVLVGSEYDRMDMSCIMETLRWGCVGYENMSDRELVECLEVEMEGDEDNALLVKAKAKISINKVMDSKDDSSI